MGQIPKVSIIIPTYNEEKGLVATLKKIRELSLDNNYEIIVVDDASTDKTFEVAKNFKFVKILRHSRNKGNGAAIKTGMRNSLSETLIFMDADGQHNPEDIPEFLKHIDKYDMVVGVRNNSSRDSWLRRPGKWLLRNIGSHLTGVNIPDLNCGFRAIRKKYALEFMPLYPDGFSLPTVLSIAMLKTGRSIKYIPIDTGPRIGGQSTVRICRDGIKALFLILRYSIYFNPVIK